MSEAGPRGVIHDLGYKRYLGTRRPQHTRLRVLARQVVSSSWRGWWRMKAWIIANAMAVAGMGVAMYVLLFISKNPVVHGLAGGAQMRWADYLVVLSFNVSTSIAFIASLTVTARLIADDTRAGAFEFYFSRPLRPLDYALGKSLGAVAVAGAFAALGPLAVCLTRVGMSSADDLAQSLALVPKTLVVSTAAALVYGVVPLAFGTFTRRRGYAVGAWAAYYVIVGGSAAAVAALADVPWLAALSVDASVMGLAYELYGPVPMGPRHAPVFPPGWVAALTLGAYVAIAFALVWWRVRRAEYAGMRAS